MLPLCQFHVLCLSYQHSAAVQGSPAGDHLLDNVVSSFMYTSLDALPWVWLERSQCT